MPPPTRPTRRPSRRSIRRGARYPRSRSISKPESKAELRADTPASGFDDSDFEWQDRRIGVEGTAFKRITFEVSRELSDDFEAAHDLSEKTAWRDVYANVRVNKALNVEAGRFKLPFGREELTGETNLDFVHRSLAARVLSPGRDVGVMAHGRLFDRRVSYQAGYFTRDGDNGRTSQTQGGTRRPRRPPRVHAVCLTRQPRARPARDRRRDRREPDRQPARPSRPNGARRRHLLRSRAT